ncbi:Cyclin-like F-box [Cordyceps javanica]|uniref:Cyclin-like F-box n=1 Tax=Cordyceps javanica TaxID=43265 RepID=A0A545VTR6_9HYPO|nr:Cyclin-like F-box [Cordyceps javanica]TQW05075.1 Cyclin-like F-box [Cordyceps javanica]
MRLDSSNTKPAEPATDTSPEVAPGQAFITSLTEISQKLLTLLNDSKEFSASHQEILDTIEQAARKYVDSGDMPGWKLNQEAENQANSGEEDKTRPSSCPQSTSTSANPENVGNADADTSLDNSKTLPTRQKVGDIPSADVSFKSHDVGEAISEAGLHHTSGDRDGLCTAESSSARLVQYLSVEDDVQLNDYIRSTRGLSLEVLKIDLLPVKASVICRALNLSSLRELTLLNVGGQAPIWKALIKENAVKPLPLRSIFTDNVSTTFLTFVSHLEELHELFLLERSVDHLPASFTPRASVTIDLIRRFVLKKHIHTLKRLMIKDESKEANWEANEKTMVMICSLGTQLEELAHVFMQYFHELVSLRAINILHFKSNDTCLWVVRETLRFMVDNLSHNPEMKLQWIAMEDDRVDRVVRPGESEDEESYQPRLSRAEQLNATGPLDHPSHPSSGHASEDSLPLPSDVIDDGDESDDERPHDNGSRLRYTTVGPMQFYDVWGIKIFEKEIRSGRL